MESIFLDAATYVPMSQVPPNLSATVPPDISATFNKVDICPTYSLKWDICPTYS